MKEYPYRLQKNPKYKGYIGKDEPMGIAIIIENSTRKVVMEIVYDKKLFEKANYHICLTSRKFEGDISVVCMDDLHLQCFEEKPKIFLTMMLHELGHVKNGDLDGKRDTETIRQDRQDKALKGEVAPEELKADKFAVDCMGKNTVMQTLDYMIKKRKERIEPNWAKEMVLNEFENRKKAVKNIKK